jgi:hypothetical protein
MLFVSGSSPFLDITPKVYEFFTSSYEIRSDVEICHCNLSDDNALGFTEVNGEEQFVQVHNKGMTYEEHCKTILHELMHVVQNEKGIIDEDERESEAYDMEGVLYKKLCASEQGVHNSGTDPQNRVS